MKERSACSWSLALALLTVGVEPRPSAAEPPAAGSELLESLATQGTAHPPAALPSTVSPAIERFVKASGGAVAPPPAAAPLARQARALPPPLVSAPADGSREAMANPALLTHTNLRAAPLESTDLRFPINLATALQLSDARPLVVAAAQARVWVAEAELTWAKVLWLPMVVYGVDYLRHDGGGPDFNKGIMTAPTVNYFMGGIGADLYFNLTDAYFQPLVARQRLNARHWETQTAKNDALMQTADAYFRVHEHRGKFSGALYTVERGRLLVDKVAELSRELVPIDEVARAQNMLADLEQLAVSNRQDWRVASADLTQVLRLDPRAVIVPLEHDHTQITLIDPARTLDELMPVALLNRPELAARLALLQAAEIAVRREKMRPLLPIVLLDGFQTPSMYIQAGLFAIGSNQALNQFRGRDDVSVQLMWQLEAFGIGNLARIKAQRGDQSRAIIELRKAQDMVAAEVMRALARVQSAAARVLQADRALRTGIITFNGHLEGLEQTRRLENVLVLTFRPQEAVYSLEQLKVSFDEYFTTVADYNRAQFELFHTLGYPARELALLRPPGELQPVDATRPSYLPPVGNGPPPASR